MKNKKLRKEIRQKNKIPGDAKALLIEQYKVKFDLEERLNSRGKEGTEEIDKKLKEIQSFIETTRKEIAEELFARSPYYIKGGFKKYRADQKADSIISLIRIVKNNRLSLKERIKAINSLREILPSEVAGSLLECLDDSNSYIRYGIILAINEYIEHFPLFIGPGEIKKFYSILEPAGNLKKEELSTIMVKIFECYRSGGKIFNPAEIEFFRNLLEPDCYWNEGWLSDGLEEKIYRLFLQIEETQVMRDLIIYKNEQFKNTDIEITEI